MVDRAGALAFGVGTAVGSTLAEAVGVVPGMAVTAATVGTGCGSTDNVAIVVTAGGATMGSGELTGAQGRAAPVRQTTTAPSATATNPVASPTATHPLRAPGTALAGWLDVAPVVVAP